MCVLGGIYFIKLLKRSRESKKRSLEENKEDGTQAERGCCWEGKGPAGEMQENGEGEGVGDWQN